MARIDRFTGLSEFLIIDAQGRILTDYQFVLDRALAPA